MLEAIDHVNLVVEDLERMARFYTSALGLKETRRFRISGEWIDRTVDLNGVVAQGVYLDPPAGPRVELIRYETPTGSRPPRLGDSNAPGLRHVAFRVRDIEQIVARLRNAGVEFFSDIQRVPTGQVDYGGGVQKHIVYFRDPEGNLLELCEYR